MESIVDLIATDSSASEITDKIKEVLYSKASERVEAIRPQISNSMFDFEVESETEE